MFAQLANTKRNGRAIWGLLGHGPRLQTEEKRMQNQEMELIVIPPIGFTNAHFSR